MNTHELLIQSTEKLIEIDSNLDWKNQLLSKAPPVLWFGNSKSNKEKILTIGANPSRWEFLDQKLIKSSKIAMNKESYERYYRSKNRFYHLSDNQDYNDIIVNEELRNQIIKSFDEYFDNEPYSWFGKNKADSYNVEGVLRGLNASYFEEETKFRGCHIDIFPFATISDFTKIKNIAERDLLNNNWAKNIVDRIIDYFKPHTILVFGRTNFNYFSKQFNFNNSDSVRWNSKEGKGKCDYWLTSYNGYQIIGVSVNLGNPKGFDAFGLNELGRNLSKLTQI